MRLLAALLCAAIAVVVAAAPIDADGDPLTLELDAAQGRCTAGSLTAVEWSISGGEEPYQLTIDGEQVNADAGSAAARCGLSLPDAPAWTEAAHRTVVRARVVDAAGRVAGAQARLTPAPPLPPPADIRAFVWQDRGDYRMGGGWIAVHTRERVDRQPGARLYLLRWREYGADDWIYEEPATSGRYLARSGEDEAPPGLIDMRYRWAQQDLRAGAVYEFQIGRIRHELERHTPGALRWTPRRTMQSEGPPRDVTAHVTHDSVTVSWRSNFASTGWDVWLSAHSSPYSPFAARQETSDSNRHTVRFDDLLPDHGYTVKIWQADKGILAEAEFDIRTERAAGPVEAAAYRPTIERVEVVGGVLHVAWLPPERGPQHRYRVVAREYGTRGSVVGILTEPGARYAALTDVLPATTYQVTVETVQSGGRRDERIVATPPEFDESLSKRDPPAARPRIDWRDNVNGYGDFHVTWDPEDGDQIAQVKWERDGYVMSRTGESPIVIDVDQPGRYDFRVRFLRGGRWSSWTGLIRANTKPPSPRRVWTEEEFGLLRIAWEPSWEFTPIDGYRVYYVRDHEEEQVLTVRDATEVVIPIENSCRHYHVRVAAFSEAEGESEPAIYRHYYYGKPGFRYEVPCRYSDVAVHFDSRGAGCDAGRDAPTAVHWTISNGVAPYKIVAQGQKPLQTSERRGWLRVVCRASPRNEPYVIPVMTTDALGNTGATTIELPGRMPDRGYNYWDADSPLPPKVEGLRSMSVRHREVRLSWHCPLWEIRSPAGSWQEIAPPRIVLRWRSAAMPQWTYATGTAEVRASKVNNGCHWTWADLEPGTRYEFQLAVWLQPEELERPEKLQWSAVEEVTTLEDAQSVRVVRSEGNIVVTWRAQPNAWAYQVILRGEGESWWKYHLPGGAEMERAEFVGTPAGASYTVEIITPPLSGGEHPTEPGFIVPPY